VRSYSRLFYFLLAPLILLLFIVIFIRVNEYGITEARYFVILIACWLAFISVYLILTGGNNIRAVPVSLCIVAFISSFGPWSAFNVSLKSQMRKLTELLEENQVLKNGVVDTTKAHGVRMEDYRRIEDIVSYMNNVHGAKALQPLFIQPLDVADAWDIIDRMKLDMLELIEDSIRAVTMAQLDSSRYFSTSSNEMINSSGYDYVNEISISNYRLPDTFKLRLRKDTLYLAYSEQDRKFNISFRNFEPLSLDAGSVLDSIYISEDTGTVREKSSLAEYSIEDDNREWKAKIIFSEIHADRKSGRTIMTSADVVLFVKLSAKGENEVGERKE
jgi:hypothetical protein